MKRVILSGIVGLWLIGCVENAPNIVEIKEKNIYNFSKDITVIDGLMYQNQPFPQKKIEKKEKERRSWNKGEAQKYCSNLNLGGYSVWRLPNQVELSKLSNVELSDDFESDEVIKKWFEKNKNKMNINSRGYKAFIKKEFIENMPNDKGNLFSDRDLFFWTSESSINVHTTYGVDFSNGARIDKRLWDDNHYTLCVRSQIDKDIDRKKIITVKGITYQNEIFNHVDKKNYDEGIEGRRVWSWQGAKKYCNTLQLESKKWRLPTGRELDNLKVDKDNNTIIEGEKVSILNEIAKKLQGTGRFWTSNLETPKAKQKRRVNQTQRMNGFQIMMTDLLFPEKNPERLGGAIIFSNKDDFLKRSIYWSNRKDKNYVMCVEK